MWGGWAVSGSEFIAAGQAYTPIEFALNGGGPNYDNAFVSAFYGTVDQALRPFLGNLSAPVNTVGIYAADACSGFGVGCSQTATTLLSLNAINATGAATVVTSNALRLIATTHAPTTSFASPFDISDRHT